MLDLSSMGSSGFGANGVGLLAFGEGLADERRKMLFNVVRYEDCNFILLAWGSK